MGLLSGAIQWSENGSLEPGSWGRRVPVLSSNVSVPRGVFYHSLWFYLVLSIIWYPVEDYLFSQADIILLRSYSINLVNPYPISHHRNKIQPSRWKNVIGVTSKFFSILANQLSLFYRLRICQIDSMQSLMYFICKL